MKSNFNEALVLVLAHEGGFSDHPKDPGGATNKGVTIGTLKRLGIDVDGDGDSDIVDLKNLAMPHLDRIYRQFYWNVVQGDAMPSGLDYAVFDFAVNSGPSRAASYLQRGLGVQDDGDIGPKTIAALDGKDAKAMINALCDRRMAFLRQLKTWQTFGKGWTRRVEEVRAKALKMADAIPPPLPIDAPDIGHTDGAVVQSGGLLARLITAIIGIIRGRA